MRSVQSLGGIPFTIQGNRSWTGFQTFAAGVEMDGVAGANVTLKLKAVAGQTGHLLEMYNQSGDLVVYYAQDGTLNSNAPQNYTGGSAFTQNSATSVGLSVKRFSSGATGNLQEWQDENGLALLKITSTGGIQSASGGLSVNSLGIGVTSANGAIEVVRTPDVTANYGTVNIGNGAWDGVTAGHFVGNGSGTILAINTATGYAASLVDFQVAGASQFKVDATGNETLAGNMVLANQNGRVDFSSTTVNTPQSNSLSGYKLRLYGSAGNNSDLGIGVGSGNLWLNTGSGGLVSFYAAGTRVAFFQNPGTTERSASANLYLPRAITQAQGITFSSGVAYDAAILRTANDDSLRFGFDSGGAFTERLYLNSAGVFVIDPASSNAGAQPAGGASLAFGPLATEGITSPRSGTNNLNGLSFWTASTMRFAIHNTGTVHLGGSTASATLTIRPDSAATNPGSGAWARSDGTGGMILEPNGTGQLYFSWTNPQQTNIGGALIVKGGVQAQNSGISTTGGGDIIASGNLTGHGGYHAVEGPDASKQFHVEIFQVAGPVGVGSGPGSAYQTSFFFSRAFTSATSYAVYGIADTSAGNKSSYYTNAASGRSTTGCIASLVNTDSNAQNFSNITFVAVGY